MTMNNLPPSEQSLHADDHRLLTVVDAADFLSLSRGTIYNLLDDGALSSIRIGRSRRIPLAALRRFVDDMAQAG
jgi:excisionase family DNA binding protein